jgi:hypothetical protein
MTPQRDQPRAAPAEQPSSPADSTPAAGSGLVTITVRPFGDPSPGLGPERRRGVALVTSWPADQPVVHVVDSGDVVVLHGRFESVAEFRYWLGLVLEVTESM